MVWFLAVVLAILPVQSWVEAIPRLGPGLNFINLVFLILAVYIFFARPDPRVAPARPCAVSSWLAAFLLVLFVGLWISAETLGLPAPLSFSDVHVQWFRDVTLGMLFYYACRIAPADEKAMRRILFALALPLPYAIWVQYDQLSQMDLDAYSHNLRSSGVFINLGPNELGAWYLYLFSAFLGVLVCSRAKAQKLFLYGALGLLAYGILFTYSRGTWLGVAGAVMVVSLVRKPSLVPLVALFVALAPVILPRSVLERADEGGGVTERGMDESSQTRLELWEYGVEQFESHPITGIGLHAYVHNPTGLDAHNLHLRTLVEHGLIGGLVWLGLLIVTGQVGWRLYRSATTPFLRGLGLGALAMWGAAMVANLFGDRLFYTPLGAVFFGVLGLAARGYDIAFAEEQAKKKQEEIPPETPPSETDEGKDAANL